MQKTEIDTATLPWVAFVDSGVLMRALSDREDEETPSCRAFWDAMLAERRQMLASAVTLAELLRKRHVPMPRVRGFTVVGFDERCATALGQRLPMDTLRETSTQTGLKLAYLKFDALIVASALRYKADIIVALDPGLRSLANLCGLRCARPSEFESKSARQLKLVIGGETSES